MLSLGLELDRLAVHTMPLVRWRGKLLQFATYSWSVARNETAKIEALLKMPPFCQKQSGSRFCSCSQSYWKKVQYHSSRCHAAFGSYLPNTDEVCYRTYLALEDVAQVAAALGAGDLGALHAKCIVDMTVHCARNLVIESRPAPGYIRMSTMVRRHLPSAGGEACGRLHQWWIQATTTPPVIFCPGCQRRPRGPSLSEG